MSETLKVKVPEDIKNMTHEERIKEIAKLEAEASQRREAKLKSQSTSAALA